MQDWSSAKLEEVSEFLEKNEDDLFSVSRESGKVLSSFDWVSGMAFFEFSIENL